MAKKAKLSAKTERSAAGVDKPAFSSPFKDLKEMLKERAALMPPPKPLPPPPMVKPKTALAGAAANGAVEPVVDEATLFQQAFAGVKRLPNGGAERIVVAPAPGVVQQLIGEPPE